MWLDLWLRRDEHTFRGCPAWSSRRPSSRGACRARVGGSLRGQLSGGVGGHHVHDIEQADGNSSAFV